MRQAKMKLLLSVVVMLLCALGATNGAALGESCSSATCDSPLVCDATANVCRKKLNAACDGDNQCITGANCPDGDSKVCTCIGADTTPNAENSACKKKIGEGCTEDDQCITGSCPASNNQMCSCASTDTTPNTENTKCIKKIGVDCSGDDDMCVDGATCQDTKCTCTNNDTAGDAVKTACVTKVGIACSGNGQCVPGAICNNSVCACEDNLVQKPDNTQCVKKLGASCTKAYTNECGNNAECPATASAKCTCTKGFVKQTESDCKSSATASAVASVLLVLAASLASPWI